MPHRINAAHLKPVFFGPCVLSYMLGFGHLGLLGNRCR